MEGKWSLNYDACVRCHTSTRRHEGGGLCSRCYYEDYRKNKKNKVHIWMLRHSDKVRNNPEAHKRAKERARENALRHYYRNRKKLLQRAKKWREENKEWVDRYKAKHKGCTPRKRPLIYWQNRYYLIHILKLDCVVCGTRKNLHAHHIIPESDGGNHDIENLEIRCEKHHIYSGLHRKYTKQNGGD